MFMNRKQKLRRSLKRTSKPFKTHVLDKAPNHCFRRRRMWRYDCTRLPAIRKIICCSRARHRVLLKLLLIVLNMIHDTTKMGTIMMRMMKTVARISEMKSYKVHVILTLVLNFPRKWTIAFTGSTALCSVVPVIATTVMTGISLSNFSFSLRFKSKLKVGTKNVNGLRFNDQQLMLISINRTNNTHMTTWISK